MARSFRSLEHAHTVLDEYSRLDPEIDRLWYLCRSAAPPRRGAHGEDAFDFDSFTADTKWSDEGWCAEDFFFQNVKSRLMLLVGGYRRKGPPELQTQEAYETVYELLLYALARPCSCCREDDDDAELWDPPEAPHG